MGKIHKNNSIILVIKNSLNKFGILCLFKQVGERIQNIRQNSRFPIRKFGIIMTFCTERLREGKGEKRMAKYENDVKELLRLIGGKENIQAVSHCMTRMRFVLVDPKKADEKSIQNLKNVKGTFTMNLPLMQELKGSVKML